MTPERELIAAVVDAYCDNTNPAYDDAINAILTTPAVQAALVKVRGQALEAVCYEYDEQAKPEPVLRWEGSELWLGEEPVAWVDTFRSGETEWNCTLANVEGDAPTLTEARTAAEQAVRDWLKRAGCV